MCVCVLCRRGISFTSTNITKSFNAHQPSYQFHPLVSPLRLWAQIPDLYVLHDLCENSSHFGQDDGGERIWSNSNCSLWLSARYVILSPTLFSRWWVWGTQGCAEWSEGALRPLMRPLIRLMRLLWMSWAFHSLPFVLWLLYTTISHLSETKEV